MHEEIRGRAAVLETLATRFPQLYVAPAEVHAALQAAGLVILATKEKEDWRSLVAGRADA